MTRSNEEDVGFCVCVVGQPIYCAFVNSPFGRVAKVQVFRWPTISTLVLRASHMCGFVVVVLIVVVIVVVALVVVTVR